MALPLHSHLYARGAALFAGFFAGLALSTFIPLRTALPFELAAFASFGLGLAGAYLGQLAFSFATPAICPACGQASAVPLPRQPLQYACRACGVASDARRVLAEQAAALESPAKQKTRDSRLPWVLLWSGIVLIGAAAWLAQDSLELLRDGVTTDARVTRITTLVTSDTRHGRRASHTAYIEYRAGGSPRVLTHTWWEKPGRDCVWPCYVQGQALRVIYLPAEPATAKVDSMQELLSTPAMVGGIGLVLILIASVMLLWRRWRRPSVQS